jgi:putative Mg2+ transporter-C (MgtC) family protein
MAGVLEAVGAEFADLSAEQAARLVTRLLVAGLAGGLLGWERWKAGKSAGPRTHILVAAGCAGFVAVTLLSGMGPDAASRVVQGLVAGIGFLGAGTILKKDDAGHVRGLTTAAGIWLTAAAGVAAGLGRCPAALLIAALGWFTLEVLGRLEHKAAARETPTPRPSDRTGPPPAGQSDSSRLTV